jgi:predicted RNA binding protein YcfA (HicA-like mRNA interferase family)
MKSISGKKLAQILEKKGWILVKTKGSHFKYQKGSDSVSVPIHSNRDLPIGTLKSIMKDANLTEDDLL